MINPETGQVDYTQIKEINIENERLFWNKFLLLAIVTIPIACPLFNKSPVNLYNNESLNNPISKRCTNNKCRKIKYLRNNSFLEHFPRTPASIIFKVIYIWLNEKSNANDKY